MPGELRARARWLRAAGIAVIAGWAQPAAAEEPPPCAPSCAGAPSPSAPATAITAPDPSKGTPALEGSAQPSGPSAQPAAITEPAADSRRKPLQIAGPETPPPPPTPRPIGDEEPSKSDGAGPRAAFGVAYTETSNDGFYGRVETEYWEWSRRGVIMGVLLGLEGWGAEDAGGGAIPAAYYLGFRKRVFPHRRSPRLFATLGVGLDIVLFDRIGRANGFGMFSPLGMAHLGVEVQPGIRLLGEARAAYRWHWTAESVGQIQIGGVLSLTSELWDGP